MIEVKSNLATQWNQVERTWAHLRPIRRPLPEAGFNPQGQLFLGQDKVPPAEQAIAFIAICKRGWKDPEELEPRAPSLHAGFSS